MTRVIIPLYIEPYDDAYPNSTVLDASWNNILVQANAFPKQIIVVAINPNNGPGVGIPADYVSAMKLFPSNVLWLGYCDTGCEMICRTPQAIEGDALTYLTWGIKFYGMFFDDASGKFVSSGLNTQLSSFAVTNNLVPFFNPGTSGVAVVGTGVEQWIIDENQYNSVSQLPSATQIEADRSPLPASQSCIIDYGLSSSTSSTDIQSYVQSVATQVSHIYIGTVVNNGSPYGSGPGMMDTLFLNDICVALSQIAPSNPTIPASPPSTPPPIPPSTVTLTINSVNTINGVIDGYYTTLTSPSGTVMTGFTPTSFSLTSNESYTLSISSFGIMQFMSWQDNGSTNPSRKVNIDSNTTLTAVYEEVTTTSSTISDSGQGSDVVPSPVTPSSNPSNCGEPYKVLVLDSNGQTYVLQTNVTLLVAQSSAQGYALSDKVQTRVLDCCGNVIQTYGTI